MPNPLFYGEKCLGTIYSEWEVKKYEVELMKQGTRVQVLLSDDELEVLDRVVNTMPGVFNGRNDVLHAAFSYYWQNVLVHFFEDEY